MRGDSPAGPGGSQVRTFILFNDKLGDWPPSHSEYKQITSKVFAGGDHGGALTKQN